MTSSQNRVQPGVPAGGEFTTTARGEPDLTLSAPGALDASFRAEVGRAIETKRDVAKRAWLAPAGPQSAYLYGREYVAARHLALLSEPDLADDPAGLEKASGKMLRTRSDELTRNGDELFARPMSPDERHQVARRMAEYAVANDRLMRSGASLTPDATRGTRDGAIDALCVVATPGGGQPPAELVDEVYAVDLSAPNAIERLSDIARRWAT